MRSRRRSSGVEQLLRKQRVVGSIPSVGSQFIMEFPINHELVEETTRLKEERRVLQDRMHKIIERKDTVSPAVYQRVHSDYADRLAQATKVLFAKKTDVDRELAALGEARAKVAANVDQQRAQLEEVGFRHGIGEFGKEQFKKEADTISEKLAKFETLLAAVDNNIKRYEELFADEEAPEDALLSPPQPVVNSDSETTAERPKASPKPKIELPKTVAVDAAKTEDTSESTAVEQFGGEYFSPPAMEIDTLALEEKTPEQNSSPQNTIVATPPKKTTTTINIIEGSCAGTTYPIHNDLMIGRSDSNDITIKEPKISRQHAALKQTATGWIIRDLRSSNGVFVNDQKVSESKLNDGDTIRIGDSVLEFHQR